MLEKCHVRNRGLQKQTEKVLCTVLLNYLHTFVFDIFSVFSTPYLHNEPQILASYIYNIGTIRKTLVPGVHYSFACLFKLQSEATLLKRYSGTGVFLQILRNFQEHLFTEYLRAIASVTTKVVQGFLKNGYTQKEQFI